MMRKHLPGVVSIAILVLLLLLSFIPVAMMIGMSLKNSLMIYVDFWSLPIPPEWSNYSRALLDLLFPALRTIAMAAVAIFGTMVFACVAAYAFAKVRMFGKEALFYLIIFIFLVPGVLTLTPSFVLASQLGMRNSLPGLALWYMGGGQVFAIFLLRTFFQAQPDGFGYAPADARVHFVENACPGSAGSA